MFMVCDESWFPWQRYYTSWINSYVQNHIRIFQTIKVSFGGRQPQKKTAALCWTAVEQHQTFCFQVWSSSWVKDTFTHQTSRFKELHKLYYLLFSGQLHDGKTLCVVSLLSVLSKHCDHKQLLIRRECFISCLLTLQQVSWPRVSIMGW